MSKKIRIMLIVICGFMIEFSVGMILWLLGIDTITRIIAIFAVLFGMLFLAFLINAICFITSDNKKDTDHSCGLIYKGIEQMQSYIKVKGAVQVGPLIQYTRSKLYLVLCRNIIWLRLIIREKF